MVSYIFLSAAGVILTGMIIYYLFTSFRNTSQISNEIVRKTQQGLEEYMEYKITKFDGEQVRGSEVVNFIKRNLGDYQDAQTAQIYVEVITGVQGEIFNNQYTNKTHIRDIKDFTKSNYYIKPTAVFQGEVIRSDNQVILGIKFTQQ